MFASILEGIDKAIIVYGQAAAAREVADRLGPAMSIVARIESAASEERSESSSIPVVGLNELSRMSYDVVLIADTPVKALYRDLIDVGVDRKKIEIANPAYASFDEEFSWSAVGSSFYVKGLGMPESCLDVSILTALYKYLPVYDFMGHVKKVSMLHVDVLTLLWHLGRFSSGAVLEIGAYVGGSAIAIAAGLAHRNGKMVTIEKGGKRVHPRFPSENIIQDLKNNILNYGVQQHVDIVEGYSQDVSTIQQVEERLVGQKIGMLVMDADGHISRAMECYAHLLEPQCFLVIDDAISARAVNKARIASEQLSQLEKDWGFQPFGVFGLGTLFGRLSR